MTSSASTASGDRPPAARPGGVVTRSYGTDPAQVYDVRLPRAGATTGGATVVVVHGGFWKAEYDRVHAEPEAQAFVDAGYPVAVVEYRRVGMPGGGVPGTLDDVRDVVTAIGRDPDLPHRLVLVGHSAGGHLVTWAANQPWAADVVGVVSLSGVVDLRASERLHLGSDAATAFVGKPPSDRAAWDAADPMASLPPRMPVRLFGGTKDDVVPVSVADEYLTKARAAGADVTLEVVPDTDHFDLIDPSSAAFARVLDTVATLAAAP